MICNNCGADLNTTVGNYCSFCGSIIPRTNVAADNQQLLRADDPRSLHRNPVSDGPTGTVKVTLKSNNNPFSPACGTTYIMNLNDGEYQIKLELMEFDTSSSIKVPYGSYSTCLEQFGYDDTTLVNPSVVKKNNKRFTIDANHNVELIIEVGTLIKPQTVTVRYV